MCARRRAHLDIVHAVLGEFAHVVVAVVVMFAPQPLRVPFLVLLGEGATGDACAGCGRALACARRCAGGTPGLP